MKGTPTHDMSLKWLKVPVSTQKHSHTFQEASYSKKSTRNKTLTFLKAIFLENPFNSVLWLYYTKKLLPLEKQFLWIFLIVLVS